MSYLFSIKNYIYEVFNNIIDYFYPRNNFEAIMLYTINKRLENKIYYKQQNKKLELINKKFLNTKKDINIDKEYDNLLNRYINLINDNDIKNLDDEKIINSNYENTSDNSDDDNNTEGIVVSRKKYMIIS